MSTKQALDDLTHESRDFYERTLMKMSLSLVFASLAFFFMGLAAQSGGKSSGYGIFSTIDGLSSDVKDSYTSSSSGFGFACFAYVVAFFVSSAASIYCSPLFRGTPNEKKTLSAPVNIDAPIGVENIYAGYPADRNSKI